MIRPTVAACAFAFAADAIDASPLLSLVAGIALAVLSLWAMSPRKVS